MKEKRIRKGLLLLMMAAALLLCGCETTQKRPVEITLIHGWGSIAGDHEAMRQIYSDFSKENPDIKIKLISMPSPAEAIRKAEDWEMVGHLPDVIFLGGGLGDDLYRYMVKNGLALDILPFLESDPELRGSVNPANFHYWTTEDGCLYMISDVLSLCGGYWYDRGILAEAGIERLPQTWQEFSEMCETINEWGNRQQNGVKALQTSPEGYLYFLNHLLAAENAPQKNHRFMADDDLMRGAFQVLQALYDRSNGHGERYSYLDETSRFNSGKLALYVNGVWAAFMIHPGKDVAYALLPGKNQTLSCVSAGAGYVLGRTGDLARQEASVRFMAYMLSPQVQTRILEETRQVPANPNVALAEYARQYERLYQAAQVVQAAERKIEIPNMAWTNTQFRIFEEHLFDVLSGQLKLQTLLDLL